MLSNGSVSPGPYEVLLGSSDFLPWTCFHKPSSQSAAVGLGFFLVARKQSKTYVWVLHLLPPKCHLNILKRFRAKSPMCATEKHPLVELLENSSYCDSFAYVFALSGTASSWTQNLSLWAAFLCTDVGPAQFMRWQERAITGAQAAWGADPTQAAWWGAQAMQSPFNKWPICRDLEQASSHTAITGLPTNPCYTFMAAADPHIKR